MASETTSTSLDDSRFAAIVNSQVKEERRPYTFMDPFFDWKPAGPSLSFQWPIFVDPGAASAKTEGTAMTNTEITDSKATATIGTVGMLAEVTDENQIATTYNAREEISRVLARSVMEKRETDYTALLDDFSNSTGTSGVELTWDTIMQAKGALAGRDITGMLVLGIHTSGANQLQRDLASSGASMNANPDIRIGDFLASQLSSFVGSHLGVPVYQSSLVPASASDRKGALFVVNEALGGYKFWDTKVERDRHIENVAWKIAATSAYGVVEIQDAYGQTILHVQ